MVYDKKTLLLFLMVCFSGLVYGQKIKYKDLFVLLNAKQYKEAEPFLKRYLKENEDNPNAFLQMGYIYEDKASLNDVLKETEKLSRNADSAVFYFERAFKEIDERELKRNDEYYQAFSRRDHRTGEFGLKVSDIQFDLERRIKSLRERMAGAKDAKQKFLFVQQVYDHSVKLFKQVSDGYKNQREFYLRADDGLVANLRRLERKYDSCLIAFNDYKITLQGLGKTGYNPQLDPQDIIDFKKDGFSSVDFLQDNLKIWDYKRWAGSNLDVIEHEIMPMGEKLTKLDSDLNHLREKLRRDSTSVVNDLTAIRERITATGLEKFDPKPFPFEIFTLKISEMNYGSELADTKVFRDSADVALKYRLYRKQVKLLSAIDSLGVLAMKRDLAYEAENYKTFVKTAYGSLDVLQSTLKSTTDFAIAEKGEKQKRVQQLEKIVNWVVDQTDSIPATAAVKSSKYTPLSIVENSHTFGFTFPDSSTYVYFYAIKPSRKAESKALFKLDSASFKKEKLPLLKGLSVVDAGKTEFHVLIYSEEFVAAKVPSVVCKITPTGLAWNNYMYLEGVPVEITRSDSGALVIKITTSSGNKLVTVLPDGKVQ
jgi:hypothetical protein